MVGVAAHHIPGGVTPARRTVTFRPSKWVTSWENPSRDWQHSVRRDGVVRTPWVQHRTSRSEMTWSMCRSLPLRRHPSSLTTARTSTRCPASVAAARVNVSETTSTRTSHACGPTNQLHDLEIRQLHAQTPVVHGMSVAIATTAAAARTISVPSAIPRSTTSSCVDLPFSTFCPPHTWHVDCATRPFPPQWLHVTCTC